MGALWNHQLDLWMKPQLYTNDFYTFQTNAYLGVEESPFFKNMNVMAQINPHSEPLPRSSFEEGFQLCGTTKYIYTLLDRPFSIQDWNSW